MQFVQIMLDLTHANALKVMKEEILHFYGLLIAILKLFATMSREKSRDQEMVLIAVIPMNVKILICVHNTRRARTAISRMSAFVMKDMKVMEMNVMMLTNVRKELMNALQMLTARIPWGVISVSAGRDFQVTMGNPALILTSVL